MLNPVRESISVIIGVRQSNIRPDCIKRLSCGLEWLTRHRFFNIIIVDTTRLCEFRRLGIKRKVNKFDATYVYAPSSIHSPARVRNIGFEASLAQDTKYCLFLDVDVLGQDGSIVRVEQDVTNGVEFEWYPVIFTAGLNGLADMRNWLENNKREFAGRINQIGFATGIHLISKNAWEKIGAYDEDFIGYGCEDIEMIHRATGTLGYRPPFKEGDPYFEDFRTLKLEEYRGYRKWFYDYKSNFLKKDMWVHFYHPRHPDSPYLKSRNRNDAILHTKMINHDKQYLS